jgi:hypothetical protein
VERLQLQHVILFRPRSISVFATGIPELTDGQYSALARLKRNLCQSFDVARGIDDGCCFREAPQAQNVIVGPSGIDHDAMSALSSEAIQPGECVVVSARRHHGKTAPNAYASFKRVSSGLFDIEALLLKAEFCDETASSISVLIVHRECRHCYLIVG